MSENHYLVEKLEQIPADLLSAADYEKAARNFMPADIYAHISAGVADEITLKRNAKAFDEVPLVHRVLRDCRSGNTRLTLLGQRFRHPILLAPVAHQRLVHEQGEVATAQAAHAMEAGLILSSLASVPMEAVAQQTCAPLWFQLYFQSTPEATLSLVRRAEQAGYQALVVTVDAPITGQRHRAQRAGFVMPASVQAVNIPPQDQPQVALSPEQSVIFQGYMREAPTWEQIGWLQTQTRLPILLKGVMHPDDAYQACDMGLAGVVVSNHGGRTLDGLPAAIEVLPAIRSAVGSEPVVLLDSGVRRGSDVFKALALGANAVLIGRPQIYALAVAGALGVAHLLRLLREELEITMALAGCPTLDAIGEEAVRR